MFIAAIFTKAKTWKQSRCLSRDKQIKKLWYIDTMEYYLALKWIGFNWLIFLMKIFLIFHFLAFPVIFD